MRFLALYGCLREKSWCISLVISVFFSFNIDHETKIITAGFFYCVYGNSMWLHSRPVSLQKTGNHFCNTECLIYTGTGYWYSSVCALCSVALVHFWTLIPVDDFTILHILRNGFCFLLHSLCALLWGLYLHHLFVFHLLLQLLPWFRLQNTGALYNLICLTKSHIWSYLTFTMKFTDTVA